MGSIQKIPPFPGEKDIHRKLGIRISSSIRGQSYPQFSELHKRSYAFYSLSHLLEGEAWLWIEGQGYTFLKAGEGILIPPNLVHSYSGHNCPYVEDAISFEGVVIDHLFQKQFFAAGIVGIGLERRLLPIIDSAQEPSEKGQVDAASGLYSLLSELYLEERGSNYQTHDKLSLLLAELQKDLRYHWSIQEMADYCSYSLNHFRSIFFQKTGMLPRRYAEHLRMEKAKELLVQNNKGLYQIADQIGYSDAFHFSKVFKRCVSISPKNYRKQFSLIR